VKISALDRSRNVDRANHIFFEESGLRRGVQTNSRIREEITIRSIIGPSMDEDKPGGDRLHRPLMEVLRQHEPSSSGRQSEQ